MAVERLPFYRPPLVSREPVPRRPGVLDMWMDGQHIWQIAMVLHREKDHITNQLWRELTKGVETSKIEPHILQDGIKSGRLPLDIPVPPAYAVKPWLNTYQWQVFEQIGRGESFEDTAKRLETTQQTIVNLGIQAREVFKEKKLAAVLRKSDKPGKPFRTLALTMWAVQDSLPEVERQLLFDVVESGFPVNIGSARNTRKLLEKADSVEIFGKYRVFFLTLDREHYVASLPIKIQAESGDGTVWLNLAEFTLEASNSTMRVLSASTTGGQAVAKKIKEIVSDYIAEWERQQRRKRELTEQSKSYIKNTVGPPGTNPPRTEKELIEAAQAGDSQALGQLYAGLRNRVYRFCLVRIGNKEEAEDLTSEVFSHTFDSIMLGQYQWRGVPFTSYLFKIAHNLLVSRYRRNGRRPYEAMLPNAILSTAAGPAEQVESLEVLEQVMKAIKQLPPVQHQVMKLRFVAGLTVAEMAQVLGKTENNIKVVQHKALGRLRKLLGDQQGFEDL